MNTLISRTLDVKIIGLEAVKGKRIFVFWHQDTFLFSEYNPFKELVIFTADGPRGDVFTSAVKHAVKRTIRVPYNEEAKRSAYALKEAVTAVEEGHPLGIAVDGPKGPLHAVKAGVFFISARTKTPISPVGIAYTKKIRLLFRWDKYVVPLPFSKAIMYIDEPLQNITTADALSKHLFATGKKAEDCLK